MAVSDADLLNHIHAIQRELADEIEARIWRTRRLHRMDVMLSEIIDLLLWSFDDEPEIRVLRDAGVDIETLDAAKHEVVVRRLNERNPHRGSA